MPDPRQSPHPGRPDGVPAAARLGELAHPRPLSAAAQVPEVPAESVTAELLERHYAIYPRSLLIATLFAVLGVVLLRDVLPRTFLWGWLGAFGAVNGIRLAQAAAFAKQDPVARLAPRWKWIAIAGHGFGGAAWGSLGAATVLLRPEAPEYLLVTLFVIAVFASFQAASPSRYPPAYVSWLAFAMGPPLLASLAQGREVYIATFAMGVLFIATLYIVARSTHRMRVLATAREVERARLLETLTRQTEALDEANRAKTRFLAAASHDLRQPMHAITLLVESLRERSKDPALRDTVESIRTSVSTMAQLLNAILDISKFDAGTVKPERSDFKVSTLLERLRVEYAGACTRKGLDLRVMPCSAIVETDPVLLYRILSNLAANAVRYTEEGRVLLGCRRRAQGLSIEVWDTGPGIPEAKHREIFREFVQLDNAQRDTEKGLGLGLAIVQRTASLLGHKVSIRSRPGQGTVFTVDVAYGDPAKVAAAPQAEMAHLDGCSVLVIDDQAEVRKAMATLLEGWGCSVHTEPSAELARQALAQMRRPPDVVIADYWLPGDDGIAVLNFIRARFPGTGGVLVSGDIAPETLKRAHDSGYTLLHKPVRPARLRALMGNLRRPKAGASP